VRQHRNLAFVDQAQRFALRFTCEHCTYFHVERERCMHGYPNAEHRAGRVVAETQTSVAAQEESAELVFCKEFELV
jgi:hypothetical protein